MELTIGFEFESRHTTMCRIRRPSKNQLILYNQHNKAKIDLDSGSSSACSQDQHYILKVSPDFIDDLYAPPKQTASAIIRNMFEFLQQHLRDKTPYRLDVPSEPRTVTLHIENDDEKKFRACFRDAEFDIVFPEKQTVTSLQNFILKKLYIATGILDSYVKRHYVNKTINHFVYSNLYLSSSSNIALMSTFPLDRFSYQPFAIQCTIGFPIRNADFIIETLLRFYLQFMSQNRQRKQRAGITVQDANTFEQLYRFLLTKKIRLKAFCHSLPLTQEEKNILYGYLYLFLYYYKSCDSTCHDRKYKSVVILRHSFLQLRSILDELFLPSQRHEYMQKIKLFLQSIDTDSHLALFFDLFHSPPKSRKQVIQDIIPELKISQQEMKKKNMTPASWQKAWESFFSKFIEKNEHIALYPFDTESILVEFRGLPRYLKSVLNITSLSDILGNENLCQMSF